MTTVNCSEVSLTFSFVLDFRIFTDYLWPTSHFVSLSWKIVTQLAEFSNRYFKKRKISNIEWFILTNNDTNKDFSGHIQQTWNIQITRNGCISERELATVYKACEYKFYLLMGVCEFMRIWQKKRMHWGKKCFDWRHRYFRFKNGSLKFYNLFILENKMPFPSL